MCDGEPGTAARLEQKQALSLWTWDKYLKMPFQYVQSAFFTFTFGFLLKCVVREEHLLLLLVGRSGTPDMARACPGNGSRDWQRGDSKWFQYGLASEVERASFGEFQLCHGKWPQPDLSLAGESKSSGSLPGFRRAKHCWAIKLLPYFV